MKLLNLVEGSEKLFHLTKLTSLSDMLVSGGMSIGISYDTMKVWFVLKLMVVS